MNSPVQITFRNMQPSAAVAARINTEVEKLDRYFPRITSCRVVVEAPHRQHRQREGFHIGINIDVPRGEIVVRHEPKQRRVALQNGEAKLTKQAEVLGPHREIYVVIRDAFSAARRQLEDYARRMRLDVKMHSRLPALRAEKEAA